jgi:hypothetical protein
MRAKLTFTLQSLSVHELIANAEILIIGGSETTASLLSGVTYLLLESPEAYRQLVNEVRSTFENQNDITLVSVNKLTYMLACLDEGMRMYPPIANGLPRVVPKGGAQVLGEWIPENVGNSKFTSIPNLTLKHRPMLRFTNGRSIIAKNTSWSPTLSTLSGSFPAPSSLLIDGMP